MHSVFLIAKREYLEQIRGRAFKFSTVLVPLLIVLLLGASYFTSHNAAVGKHLVIAADSVALANAVRNQLLGDKDAGLAVDVAAPATRQERDNFQKSVQNKAIDGLLVIDTSLAGAPVATYTSLSASDSATREWLETALDRGLLNERLIAKGLKPDEASALLKKVSVKTLQVNKQGKAARGSRMASFYAASAMAFLLTMPIMLYGMDMARSIIDEKSSRIFEVMLSVASPGDLFAGKLLGVGAVGFTQVAIWMAAAAVLACSALAAPLHNGDLAFHLSWAEGLLFPLYFVLGFFLYSAFFSGLAATCETTQELQMYMPLAAAPVWLSFGILPLMLSDPSSIWVTAASLFPLTAPFVMLPRMGLDTPPLWQFAVSISLLILNIWAVLWFSSRLYRVGILMYGKRATLPEFIRWLRYS